MNWPEHLLMLHRLSGVERFRFRSDRGELRVHLLDNPFFPFWLPDNPEGSQLKSEGEIADRLRRLPNLVLVEAS